MKWKYLILAVAVLWLCGPLSGSIKAEPLTNESALFKWTATTDPNIRYEIRWQHFLHPDWMTITTDQDSTTGQLAFTFPAPFADSTGDRFVCFDMRAHWIDHPTDNSRWSSEETTAGCNQVPLAVVVPPPTPNGLQVASATPDQVVIVAAAADCPRVVTSTKGSTATTIKRTVTCVR